PQTRHASPQGQDARRTWRACRARLAAVEHRPGSTRRVLSPEPRTAARIRRMPVPVLVDQIFRRLLTERSEPLRTVRGHPDEVARRDRVPLRTEEINPAALQHQQAA